MQEFNQRPQEVTPDTPVTGGQDYYEQALRCFGGALLVLDNQDSVIHMNPAAIKILGQPVGGATALFSVLRPMRAHQAEELRAFIQVAQENAAVTKMQPVGVTALDGSKLLIDAVVGPRHGDAQGQIDGSFILFRVLADLSDGALPEGLRNERDGRGQTDASIVLLGPDDFGEVNQEFSRNTGDKVLQEIHRRIQSVLRLSDLCVRYDSAVYLLYLPDTNAEQAKNLVARVQQELTERPYLGQYLKLQFSLGCAVSTPGENWSNTELFYFANQALQQARILGGNQLHLWKPLGLTQQMGNLDRLGFSVSQHARDDYQRMLAVWSGLNALNKPGQEAEFAHRLVRYLAEELSLARCGVVDMTSQGPVLLQGIDQQQGALMDDDIRLTPAQLAYLHDPGHQQQRLPPHVAILPTSAEVTLVPVRRSGTLIAALWLQDPELQGFNARLDDTLLNNIADFCALNLPLPGAIEGGNRQATTPSRPAQQAAQHGTTEPFWYRCGAMQQLMNQLIQVAPTEATVLITGESGTGKEHLARSVHLASTRKDKPFVVFDCGAVVPTLIEKELFGAVKGAYTGADKAEQGSIAEAEGGTLFLDEVGELPLDIQTKLLRFVQERQYAQVGSQRYRSADVRIVAATNVDLQQQVANGGFRQDLYYRLNVFNLASVPLRERGDDVQLLAQQYLKYFSQQYNKPGLRFAHDAQRALDQYSWPGNVRELKNLLQRAVILCDANLVQCSHLGLYPDTLESATGQGRPLPPAIEPRLSGHPGPDIRYQVYVEDDQQQHVSAADAAPQDDAWSALIRRAVAVPELVSGPCLADRLEASLYRLVMAESGGVLLQAAIQLSLPESTFRRRWQKLRQADFDLPESLRLQSSPLLSALARTGIGASPTQRLQQALLLACKALGLTMPQSLKLLGVSPPTYRKLLQQLQQGGG